MTTTTQPPEADAARFVAVARSGDASAFARTTERYRRELHVHCYRMVASFDDAQDLTQEVFLRAWRARATFEGRSSLRAWLYRIATNVCLDFLARRPERVPLSSSTQDGGPAEVAYLQPYPDRLLDELASDGDEPGHALVAKETIELAFLVAVQHLPARQRAVLVLRDVVGWPASETAAVLDSTVAAVNSALQRARATMRRHLPDRRMDWTATTDGLTGTERTLLQRYMRAHADNDVDALVGTLHEDLRFAMPPEPGTWIGREAIVRAWIDSGFGSESLGRWRCVLVEANRQPAVVTYLRRPDDTAHRAFALDVLTLHDDVVTEITTFPIGECAAFGLPETLDDVPPE